ncbi:hypothetical protein ACPZ19_49330 [Amycolatopsis lurida]
MSRLEAALSDRFVESWSLTGAAVVGGRDWALLLDSADPVALLNRQDLFVLQATTWHLAALA